MVYNTALAIVQHEQDAEDITQDVFIKVYQHLDEFRKEAMLSTWIYRVTINSALDAEKKKKRAKYGGGLIRKLLGFHEEEEAVNFNHPGVELDKKEQAAILFYAMKKLPEKQRIAFTLNKVEGLSNREIAEIMKGSIASVDSLLARANANLRKMLNNYYSQL